MHSDTTDVALILAEVLLPGHFGFRFENADVANNGTVTAADASYILQYTIGTRTPDFDTPVQGLLNNGISAGATISDGVGNSRTIRAVLSDTTFEIAGDSLAQYTNRVYTITQPGIDRAGIYYNSAYYGNAAILLNWDNPLLPMSHQEEIVRLLGSPDGLYIYGKRSVWILTGTTDFTVTRLANATGIVGPAAACPYGTGFITVQQEGAYSLSGSASTRFSDILGSAITDSAGTNRGNQTIAYALDDDIYLVVPSSGDATTIWKCDATVGVWTKYLGWYVGSMADWPTGGDSRHYAFWGDKRKGNVYKVDPTRTADVSISGADSSITAQVITPSFNFAGADAEFIEAYIGMDSNDSVRVTAEITQRDTVMTVTCLVLSPYAGDSSYKTGVERKWVVPINEIGSSCQLTIWTQGTKRCTIYPGAVIAKRRGLR
jgi:hypothetical protein